MDALEAARRSDAANFHYATCSHYVSAVKRMSKEGAVVGPLDGVKVFDLTVAGVGPWATMLLASMGANVVKVETAERSGGMRRGDGTTYNGLGSVYMHCHMGKRGIFLDLKTTEGQAHARRLLSEADVFVENMKWGTVQRLGLSYDEVSKLNPRIVYGNYPGWGSTGPYKDRGSADGMAQAFAGPAGITGRRSGKPESIRWYALHDFNASSYIVGSVLLGLLRRMRVGKGGHLMSPQQANSVAVQTSRIAEFLATGQDIPRLGSACTTTVPHRAFICQENRWLAIGVVKDDQWRGLCKAIGAQQLLDDPRFATNPGRVQNRDELEERLQAVFRTKPAQWWLTQLRKYRVPASLFYDRLTVPDMPQMKANNLITFIDYPKIGKLPYGNLPYQLSRTPVGLRPGIWPGQDTEQILKEGFGKDGNTDSKGYFGPKGAMDGGALNGVTVVDMTQGLCGPYASLLMADAGARVIKIEPPEGDYARQFRPPMMDGTSAVFFHLNRNKEGRRLSVRKKAERQKLLELLKTADIFIEEEGQGALKRLGLSYEDVERANPGLVYCTITPHGTKGPLRSQPASELTLQAMSDFISDLGTAGEEPVRMGPDMASLGTSLFVFHGVLGALYHKWRTGEGQHVSVSMLGTLIHQRGITWLSTYDSEDWSGFYCDGDLRVQDHGYETADQLMVMSSVRNPEELPRLLKALGIEESTEHPLFQHPVRDIMGWHGDTELASQAKPIWEAAFKRWTAEDLVGLLKDFGSIGAITNTYSQLFSHPQMEALDMVTEQAVPKFGVIKFIGPPWQLFGVPKVTPRPYEEQG